MNQESYQFKTPEHVALSFNLAGLGSRGAALMLDTLVITLMQAGMFALIYFANFQSIASFSNGNSTFIALVVIISFVLNWGYFFLFEWIMGGQTPGKRILGIRVIQERGGNATAISLVIRNLVRIIDMLPVYYFAGMIIVFLHPQHKRLGDLVAGTLVVHERKTRTVRKKQSAIEKEIERRGLQKSRIGLDDAAYRSFTKRDWDLLKTYVDRFLNLSVDEREAVTSSVAEILLPKAGLEDQSISMEQTENRLLLLYLILRDEWNIEI